MNIYLVMLDSKNGLVVHKGFLDEALANELSNRINESAQSRGDGTTSWVSLLPIADAPLPSQGQPE